MILKILFLNISFLSSIPIITLKTNLPIDFDYCELIFQDDFPNQNGDFLIESMKITSNPLRIISAENNHLNNKPSIYFKIINFSTIYKTIGYNNNKFQDNREDYDDTLLFPHLKRIGKTRPGNEVLPNEIYPEGRFFLLQFVMLISEEKFLQSFYFPN
jgi:hypothetical protein